ncbi:hypothetical protein XELAEV_18021515mg [Xenopus laevis]|uniref:Uncharacterized protein n=1 Tax=Xenopus laevis TaxID=8355 RepID=A0A974DBP3_XENLA|nr:hypothetical protein XELAEV_18021515mg [Xenopus laevis]
MPALCSSLETFGYDFLNISGLYGFFFACLPFWLCYVYGIDIFLNAKAAQSRRNICHCSISHYFSTKHFSRYGNL